MSRSNHYRLCDKCGAELCERHRSPWSRYVHKPIRTVIGRRTWERKSRYPDHSVKAWHSGPPRWWWQEKHSTARAIYRALMREEDPALPREKDLIDLWSWY